MPLAIGDIKICSACKTTKRVHEFDRHKNTRDGLNNVCKRCKRVMARNSKHGLKNGSIAAMQLAQDGQCAICITIDQELVLDHCHKTGVIRQLLCRKCNALLGMCNDSLSTLNSATLYLQKWTEE